jgi:hypothetical protein
MKDMDLFNLKPEKYFAPPSTWDRERAREAILIRIDSDNYLASEKMDGYWSRFVRQGDECKQQSRTVSKITGTYGEFQEKIPYIFNFLKTITTGDTVLLGELYALTRNVNDVKSILGAGVHKALARQQKDEDKLRFYIFDVLYYDGKSFMDVPFEERAEFLTKVVKPKVAQNPFISVAEFFEGYDALEKLDEILFTGGEGIVLQRKDGLPEPGKRTAWKTIKMKKELERDADVFMIRALPPTREYNGIYLDSWPFWEDMRTGKLVPLNLKDDAIKSYRQGGTVEPVSKNYYYGWPSAIECGVYDHTGKIWPVCAVSGLTDAVKQDIVDNPKKYVRRAMTLTGMEFTDDYSIRHPRLIGFRDDITDKDCTWEKIFDRDY